MPRPPHSRKVLAGFCACLMALLTAASAQEGASFKIFDGNERTVLYRTSSHEGGPQLEELLHLVPGGMRLSVYKMPYKWTVEQMKPYAIQVRRMNNAFNSRFKIQGPDDAKALAAAVEELKSVVAEDLRSGAQVIIYHAGHYHENSTDPNTTRLIYNDRLAYLAMTQANKDPRLAFLDTLTATKAFFPATVRTDGFHASTTANYLEGLEIIKAMCAHDGIPLPPAVQQHVDAKVTAEKAKADIIVVEYPNLANTIAEELMTGDTITIHWHADPQKVSSTRPFLHAVFNDDYIISETIPLDASGNATFTWTVSTTLPTAGNSPKKDSQKSDVVTIGPKNTQNGTFCFRIIGTPTAGEERFYAFSARFKLNLSGKPRATPKHFDLKPNP